MRVAAWHLGFVVNPLITRWLEKTPNQVRHRVVTSHYLNHCWLIVSCKHQIWQFWLKKLNSIRRVQCIEISISTSCITIKWVTPYQKNLQSPSCVKLQNLSWNKTGFVTRQVLHLLSRLQNWISPKTGQYKTCMVSNTKIEASIQATKPKPWQSHLTSETVEIFVQNEEAGLVSMKSRFMCGRFRVGAKPVLVRQV